MVWYFDGDGEYGDPLNSQTSCTQPIQYVVNDQDCDDTMETGASINPDSDEDVMGLIMIVMKVLMKAFLQPITSIKIWMDLETCTKTSKIITSLVMHQMGML